MNTLFAFLPCYNEQENIGLLIDGWLEQCEPLAKNGLALKITGIDDCSTDQTASVIREKSERFSNVRLLSHPSNKGLCGGLNSAIEIFLQSGLPGDYMVIMDGDNTHDPVYIHKMIRKIRPMGGKNADCVIASRYCPDSQVMGVTTGRKFFSDMARKYYSTVLKVPGVNDYTCGYRLYTYGIIRSLTEQFGRDPVKEQSFACMMELLYKLYLVGATFDEIGFTLRYDRKRGESKMPVFATVMKSLSTAITLRHLKGRI